MLLRYSLALEDKRLLKKETRLNIFILSTKENLKSLSTLEKERKRINRIAEEEELIRPLLAHEDAKRCQAVKQTKEWHNPSRVPKRVRLSILGDCKIFGDNDARFERDSSITVVSNSINGVLFKIKASEFIKHVKNDDEAWNKFTEQ